MLKHTANLNIQWPRSWASVSVSISWCEGTHSAMCPLRIKAVVEPCDAMRCAWSETARTHCALNFELLSNVYPDTFSQALHSVVGICGGKAVRLWFPRGLGAPKLASFILSHFHSLFSLRPLFFLWSFSRLVSNYCFTTLPFSLSCLEATMLSRGLWFPLWLSDAYKYWFSLLLKML